MNNITTIGIDLAKNVFQLHGADASGKRVLRKRLQRSDLGDFIANLPRCLIGMEACGSSHYWARLFRSYGHEVKLMSPQYVKPYIKTNKNDVADAEGIAEAVTRPNMRFVPIKETYQQDILCLHKVRERLVGNKTALSNQIRGLLLEYGISIPQGGASLRKILPEIISLECTKLSAATKALMQELNEEYLLLTNKVAEYEGKIVNLAKSNEQCKILTSIPGIGPITATALYASLGDVNVFKKGRDLSAWLGLVPKQSSSGNKIMLLGISKRGNSYLRRLLVQGAHSVMRCVADKKDKFSRWLQSLIARSGYNKAAVALANKNARIVWALLNSKESFNYDLACGYDG